MAFVAKVGFNPEPVKPEASGPKNINVLNILPGLPEERQKQIAESFEKQAKDAWKVINQSPKELPRGR